MRVIEVDGSEWATPLDFCRALGKAVGAQRPVNNLNALLEYMVWDWEGMGAIEPPYVVRVVNAAHIPNALKDEIALFADVIKDAQGGHLEVILEWPPGAFDSLRQTKLNSSETDLVGSWIETASGLVGDAVEQRIVWLIEHHLLKVATSPKTGGWEILYCDPEDGRYWELTYPRGEMHGGGPRRLTNITEPAARRKFALSD